MSRFLSLVIGLVIGVMILLSHDVVMAMEPHRGVSADHQEHPAQVECGSSQGAPRSSEDGFDPGVSTADALTFATPAMGTIPDSSHWNVPVLTGSVLRAMLQVYLN